MRNIQIDRKWYGSLWKNQREVEEGKEGNRGRKGKWQKQAWQTARQGEKPTFTEHRNEHRFRTNSDVFDIVSLKKIFFTFHIIGSIKNKVEPMYPPAPSLIKQNSFLFNANKTTPTPQQLPALPRCP